MSQEQIQTEINKLEAELDRENPWITDPRVKRLRELYTMLKTV